MLKGMLIDGHCKSTEEDSHWFPASARGLNMSLPHPPPDRGERSARTHRERVYTWDSEQTGMAVSGGSLTVNLERWLGSAAAELGGLYCAWAECVKIPWPCAAVRQSCREPPEQIRYCSEVV